MTTAAEPVFELTATDINSSVWNKLKTHMEAKLLALRIKNDSDMDPIKTAAIRGEIRNLKNLLALGIPAPELVADEESPE